MIHMMALGWSRSAEKPVEKHNQVEEPKVEVLMWHKWGGMFPLQSRRLSTHAKCSWHAEIVGARSLSRLSSFKDTESQNEKDFPKNLNN